MQVQNIDLLWMSILWGPWIFTVFAGCAFLMLTSGINRAFSWVFPGAWVVIEVIALIWAVNSGEQESELFDLLKFQVVGLVVIAFAFMFIHAIIGLWGLVRWPKRFITRSAAA